MADYDETASWQAPIAKWSTTTPANGDQMSVPLQQIVHRTVHLKTELEALQQALADLTSGADPFAQYLKQDEGDARYLQAVPTEYLTETEGDVRYLQGVPAEFLTQAEGDAAYAPIGAVGGGGDVTAHEAATDPHGQYMTQNESDARYLQNIPTEFLTQDEGDARYSTPPTVINIVPATDWSIPTGWSAKAMKFNNGLVLVHCTLTTSSNSTVISATGLPAPSNAMYPGSTFPVLVASHSSGTIVDGLKASVGDSGEIYFSHTNYLNGQDVSGETFTFFGTYFTDA